MSRASLRAGDDPYVSDPDFVLHLGDVRDVLATLPDESIDCAMTSPPFYGLRDYGTGRWEGGDSDHEHDTVGARGGRGGSGALDKRSADAMPSRVPARVCSCGAAYHDPQIGMEATPDEWVAELVAVFREVGRVLKPQGTLWVEIGDSYNSGTSGTRVASTLEGSHGYWANPHIKHRVNVPEIKTKDLIGAPWLLAFALRADGWYLRQEIIWEKPNAMPESANDRCTTSHSRAFLLAKSGRATHWRHVDGRIVWSKPEQEWWTDDEGVKHPCWRGCDYWFDKEAIMEPAEWARWGDQTVPKHEGTDTSSGWIQPKSKREIMALADHRYDGLVGQKWKKDGRQGNGQRERNGEMRGFDERRERADGLKNPRSVWTIPTQGYPEAHFATWPEALCERIIKAGCPEGGVILDPFMGAGTTALVARRLGRKSVGVELNPEYAELCARRLAQQSLLAEPAA